MSHHSFNNYQDADRLDSSIASQADFSVRVSIGSPEFFLRNSFGEVKKADTANYRTLKPEHDGLFCARIFGPVRDYECLCGKYKRMKYRGIVCDKCGVEVTSSRVRRHRMGHVELVAPVVHTWFLRSLPSRIGTLLDLPLKDLERTIYFGAYMVADPGITSLKYGQLLSEDEYYEAQDAYGEDSFKAGIGAEIIREMLANIDLNAQRRTLRENLLIVTSETKRRKIVRKLKLVEQFVESGNKPEWMVMTILPVLPPDLRPLVMLDGGRFAASDLNELYRRVINRNNRLRRLTLLKAPQIIINNERCMLQESVNALLDNATRGGKVLASARTSSGGKRALKSLSDMLKGKQGRFRQNLLGKRVDYSGRSVIVVGPELKLHQCGLPKKMAIELFKPFVYAKLELYGIVGTLKSAKKFVDAERPEVWDMLEEVVKDHPVLLNRAPTLHRLGIQAFEPILVEGKAIQLHPLVCTAFNADFDGDQMAVHVPLSLQAQLEASVLMMSVNNVLSPAHGKPMIVPTQDIVLGIYYMTIMIPGQIGEGRCFVNATEVECAMEANVISLHTKIKCRRRIADFSGTLSEIIVETTPGRIMVAEILIALNANIDFSMINKTLNKKEMSKLIEAVYHRCGREVAVAFADDIMRLGFKYVSKSGISFGKDDILVPNSKRKHIDDALNEVRKYDDQYAEGIITSGERYNKVIDAWSRCTEKISFDAMQEMSTAASTPSDKINSIFMMMDSGARGSIAQVKQLAGMRGLITKPSGEILEVPIISNFKEGLTVLEYFISTHGSRKGLVDTALKTANAGYLTRKLIDVAQDCVIRESDCGTINGLIAKAIIENGEIVVSLSDVIVGRVAAIAIRHIATHNVIVNRGQIIDEKMAALIEECGIESVKIRSPLTCQSTNGVCACCYGRDLSTASLVDIGTAVGIIAAESIGEPGTQLTMRTFHIGGAAQRTIVQSRAETAYAGHVRFAHKNVVVDSRGYKIVMSANCEAVIVDENDYEKARYKIPYGATLFFNDKDPIARGQIIAEWDPFTIPIITETSGIALCADLVKDISIREIYDEVTGVINRIVIDSKRHSKGHANLQPRIVLSGSDNRVLKLANGLDACYVLPVDAVLNVKDGDEVCAGDILARIPKESSKSKDITGGLPRIVELFEARQHKDDAIISEVDGYVEFGKDYKSKRRVIIRSSHNKDNFAEYFLPRGRYITVKEGDYVTRGDMLMDGRPSPHDILRVIGIDALAEYVIQEVQQVYRLQGVSINDKHIEVILRQMLQKIEVTHPGGTTFIAGEHVDKEEFHDVNQKTVSLGYKPAEGTPILLGITKASLQNRSFLAAASFQETIRVLTEASISGKIDSFLGVKESVIAGRLIPAGTGFYDRGLTKEARRLKEMGVTAASMFSAIDQREDDNESFFNSEKNDDHYISGDTNINDEKYAAEAA